MNFSTATPFPPSSSVPDFTDPEADGYSLPNSGIQATLDALPCGFLQLDATNHIVLWNHRLAQWTGRTRAEVTGHHLDELFSDSRTLAKTLAGIRESGRTRTVLDLFTLERAHALPTEFHLVPLAEPAGHVAISIVELSVPLTRSLSRAPFAMGPSAAIDRASQSLRELAARDADLQRTEAELHAYRERLDLALDAARTCTWDNDLTSNILRLDSRWSVLLGGEPEPTEVPAHTLLRLIHPDDRAATVEKIRGCTRASETHYRVEHRVKTLRGEWIWVLSVGRVVARDANGKATRVIGTNTDISQLKAAEAELRAYKDRLDLALEAANTCTWDHDVPGNNVTLDARWSVMLGGPAEPLSISGTALMRKAHRADLPTIINNLRDCHEGQALRYRVEHRVKNRRGEWIWVLSSGRVVARDAQGRATRIIGTNTDITARKHAESELFRQTEFLATLHQTTLDLLAHGELRDVFQTLLERASAIMEAPFAELLVKEGDELVVSAFTKNHPYTPTPRVTRAAAPLSWQAHDTGRPIIIDDYSARPDPQARYEGTGVRALAEFPVMLGRNCVGVLSLGRERSGPLFSPEDVQKGALLAQMAALVLHNAGIREAALREAAERNAARIESEERFRVLAEVSPAGIFSTDANGAYIFVNRRWCEFAGLTAAQAAGYGWQSAIHPDDRMRVAELWADAVRTGQSFVAEYRFQRSDGAVTWLVGQSRAQFNSDNTVAGYVGTITDVTSLKRVEAEREKIEGQLRQTQKIESLGTLAGGIAHDFNNILTGMFGFVDLARLEFSPDHPAKPWLDQVALSCQRAKELVQQILTFSRRNEAERIPLRLHAAVGEALRLMRATLPAMIEIQPRIASDTSPVLADATQIHQVVMNLCTNAWHALPERDGRILVSLENWRVTAEQAATHPDLRAGLYVRLLVADNGSGMDPATLERIFDPFFTTKGAGKGTGLGLAVVHGIVKSHGGAIGVQSVPGSGTTFELYFPALVAAEAPVRPAVSAPEVPRGRDERVLIVDDDAVTGFVIERLIASCGYQVRRFTRPLEALEYVKAAPDSVDLVISDLAMPKLPGDALAEELRRVQPSLPVILITGFLDVARQHAVEKSGIRAIVRKPPTREELARVIGEYVRK